MIQELGPVHLVAQDIAGGTAYRLAAGHPEDVLSLAAVEMGLAGYGLEALARTAWYVGVLAEPGLADLLFPGHERELLAAIAYAEDEFVRTYSRPGGWSGAVGLYRSMLAEGPELRALPPVTVPVLAVGRFAADTMRQVTRGEIAETYIDGVGHYVAQEAPDRLADAILRFIG